MKCDVCKKSIGKGNYYVSDAFDKITGESCGGSQLTTCEMCEELRNLAPDLLDALRSLAKQIDLRKLNIRKDFGLINAHAYAEKVIHKTEVA